MIQLVRPAKPPQTLADRGMTATANLKRAYSKGKRAFTFQSAIYAASDVRSALRVMHHGKCAFCESILPQITAGNVEHFRPKGEVQQDDTSPPLTPGYYWLAYDWENLFLACEWCNSRAKKTLFPLEDPAKRARDHNTTLSEETPLLLNPALDRPEEHLEFEEELVRAQNESPRGAASIEVYRLNDRGLTEERKKKLDLFRVLVALAKMTEPMPEAAEARQQVERWLKDIQDGKMEYAGMLRANLEAPSETDRFPE